MQRCVQSDRGWWLVDGMAKAAEVIEMVQLTTTQASTIHSYPLPSIKPDRGLRLLDEPARIEPGRRPFSLLIPRGGISHQPVVGTNKIDVLHPDRPALDGFRQTFLRAPRDRIDQRLLPAQIFAR